MGYYTCCIIVKEEDHNPNKIENDVDDLISKRVDGDLKFLDQITFKMMNLIPKDIRKLMNDEKRILKNDNFIFLNND
jgi:hypothetical protein